MFDMVFRDDFYFIDAKERTDAGFCYTLHFNADHLIYKAHFPGEPITPGVCILQVGLDLLADAVDCELEVVNVKNVKFLSVLRPDMGTVSVEVQKIEINDGLVKAQVSFHTPETPIAKMSLQCRMLVK